MVFLFIYLFLYPFSAFFKSVDINISILLVQETWIINYISGFVKSENIFNNSFIEGELLYAE
jgi:hypothetical protein